MSEFIIARITVLYVPAEDRIALDVADASECVHRLWMTQRLLDRLVLALVKRLPAELPPDVDDPSLSSVTRPAVHQAGQVYAQLQARLVRKPEPAVRADSDTPAHLVSEVQINSTDGRVWTLLFQYDAQSADMLRLPAAQLRQWLDSLYRAYRTAGWSGKVWPDWIGGSARRHTAH